MRGLGYGGLTARSKNFKTPFFSRYAKFILLSERSWSKNTPVFFFLKISTNMVSRGVQNFCQNWPWRAGCLSNGQNFYVNLAKTCDKEMLKISGRYLDSCLSNGQITENLLPL